MVALNDKTKKKPSPGVLKSRPKIAVLASLLLFAASFLLSDMSTVRNLRVQENRLVLEGKGNENFVPSRYQQSEFIPLEEIEKELKKSDYVPEFECELCLSGKSFHTLLYVLAKHASGPVLEEGSFCGCSTAVLAIGLRDAAKDQDRQVHPLITADAFPVSPTAISTPNQYRDVDGNRYELYVWEKLAFTAPGGMYDAMKKSMIPTIERDGSILPCLMRTLYNNNLQDDVTVIAGSSNTAPLLNYRLIFTDATHSMEETLTNEPIWSKHLFNGYPVIIAFHDIAQLPDVQKYILDKYKPTHYILTNEYFVMEMDGQPLVQQQEGYDEEE